MAWGALRFFNTKRLLLMIATANLPLLSALPIGTARQNALGKKLKSMRQCAPTSKFRAFIVAKKYSE